MVGGAGNDTYLVDVTADATTEAANAGTDTCSRRLELHPRRNVENLTFVGAGNFTGNGNALANLITGGAGNDTLNGADGNRHAHRRRQRHHERRHGQRHLRVRPGFGADTVNGFDANRPAAARICSTSRRSASPRRRSTPRWRSP